jgi:hypothetical protein
MLQSVAPHARGKCANPATTATTTAEKQHRSSSGQKNARTETATGWKEEFFRKEGASARLEATTETSH